ncbi:PPOX class F420-dependent oxidoreductase [Streptomyces sp. NPDC051940]|uniref:PPOX class F420-dependent oxidoreductase n=1 Tax=Streptomyces sp. NPDC051940 TaxID=3155675 RepID=UPI003427B2D4
MSAIDEIRRSKYISLTTYRKDGTPVATPVWYVEHDGALWVVTPADSWKVKRIRANASVTVAACDVRGRTAPGAGTAPGTARLLDEAGTAQARALLARRYPTSRIGNALARALRIRRKPMTGLTVTL